MQPTPRLLLGLTVCLLPGRPNMPELHGPPAASLSPSRGSYRGRRDARVHRRRVPGRSSPPVPHESLHPFSLRPRPGCRRWAPCAPLQPPAMSAGIQRLLRGGPPARRATVLQGQCGDEDDDHSDIVMPTPRRQSPRPTTPFTDGRHHAEVGIIVYAKTCCGW